MRIVLCSGEVFPFAKTGGLADVAGALPLALEALGQEVIIVMPKYASVSDAGIPIKKLKAGFSYSAGKEKTCVTAKNSFSAQQKRYDERSEEFFCASIGKNIKVYFVENDAYYDRPFLYGDKAGDYPDNLMRFSFYCEKTLELLKVVNFPADIIHCNDWQTTLIPVLLKTSRKNDSFYKNTKTVLTIHNLAYQGLFKAEEFAKLKLDQSLFGIDGFEFYGKISFLKAGILFADYITTVSQGYAKEMLTKEFGCGLEAVLEKRKSTLQGIINGLDYSVWDPKKDTHIFKQYNAANLSGKSVNKKQLQKSCGLLVKKDIPLLGFVGRLAEQKGVDLLLEVVKKLDAFNVQMIVLGTGDQKYHALLEKVADKNPKRFSLHFTFDETLAHRIYAGSDMFFMPSRYEPCGLGQMISFKYGTIPIAYKTGGLSDTVFGFDPETQEGNGFIFDSYSKKAFLDTVQRGVALFSDGVSWQPLLRKVMNYNFSWEESAKKYIHLFNSLQ